jgi:hypothetical protein
MGAHRLTVRRLNSGDDITGVHRLGAVSFSDAAQCTPGFFWPSMRQLERTQEIGGAIYVASADGDDVGFITVEPSGQVMWLRADAGIIGEVCAACCAVSVRDFGECWGVVASDTVRAAAVDADPAHFVDEGQATKILRFVP